MRTLCLEVEGLLKDPWNACFRDAHVCFLVGDGWQRSTRHEQTRAGGWLRVDECFLCQEAKLRLRSGFDTGTHPQRAAATAATEGAGVVRGLHNHSENRTLGMACQTETQDGSREFQNRTVPSRLGGELFFAAALLPQQTNTFSLKDSHAFNRDNHAYTQHWQRDTVSRWNFC
jgi:hypothetical protein